MKRLAVLIALVNIPAAATAKDLRFVGTWDCGGSTVTFTDSAYDPGTGPVAIKMIEGDGHDFAITLAGGRSITVSVSDDEQTMQVGAQSCRRRG